MDWTLTGSFSAARASWKVPLKYIVDIDVYFHPCEGFVQILMKHIPSTALYKGGSAVSRFFGIFPYTLVARSVLRVERSPWNPRHLTGQSWTWAKITPERFLILRPQKYVWSPGGEHRKVDHFEVTKVSHFMAVTGLADGCVAPWGSGERPKASKRFIWGQIWPLQPCETRAAYPYRGTRPVISDTYQRLNGRWNPRNAPPTADNPSRTPPEPSWTFVGHSTCHKGS